MYVTNMTLGSTICQISCGGQVVCKKLQITNHIKELNSDIEKQADMPDLAWDRNWKLGSLDRKYSLSMLIEWWTSKGNYYKFRGKNKSGISSR